MLSHIQSYIVRKHIKSSLSIPSSIIHSSSIIFSYKLNSSIQSQYLHYVHQNSEQHFPNHKAQNKYPNGPIIDPYV